MEHTTEFILVSKQFGNKVFIGDTNKQIPLVSIQSDAEIFDSTVDNPEIKQNYYKAITGFLDLEIKQ